MFGILLRDFFAFSCHNFLGVKLRHQYFYYVVWYKLWTSIIKTGMKVCPDYKKICILEHLYIYIIPVHNNAITSILYDSVILHLGDDQSETL